MNLEARKIEFIQEFLQPQSLETISKLEKILLNEKSINQVFEPMTQEELDNRIEQSESDFENNRFKYSSQLLAKYD